MGVFRFLEASGQDFRGNWSGLQKKFEKNRENRKISLFILEKMGYN